jgi:hypothetical protein
MHRTITPRAQSATSNYAEDVAHPEAAHARSWSEGTHHAVDELDGCCRQEMEDVDDRRRYLLLLARLPRQRTSITSRVWPDTRSMQLRYRIVFAIHFLVEQALNGTRHY